MIATVNLFGPLVIVVVAFERLGTVLNSAIANSGWGFSPRAVVNRRNAELEGYAN